MKYLGNLSLGWCLCMAMIGIAMPASSLKAQTVGVASSLQAQTVGREYREDSLVTLVDSMMPRLDSMDGQTLFKNYFATIDKVVKPKEWADRLKADRWKAYLAKHPTTWHQYLVTEQGNKMLDDVYFCEGIPRFIIIDKQGKLINADAMRPSDEAFAEYFKKIVNN